MFLLLSLPVNSIKSHDKGAFLRGKAEQELDDACPSMKEVCCPASSLLPITCCKGFSCSGYFSRECYHNLRLKEEHCGFLMEVCDYNLMCDKGEFVGLKNTLNMTPSAHARLGTQKAQ